MNEICQKCIHKDVCKYQQDFEKYIEQIKKNTNENKHLCFKIETNCTNFVASPYQFGERQL